MGLDVREYTYGHYTLDLINPGVYRITAGQVWLVTRATLFTKDNFGHFATDADYGNDVVVSPNSCYQIEPNGAFRGGFRIDGQTGLFVVEFWNQAQQGAQGIPIFTTDPGP
jgi:hypothetical protein